jgi:hypothetical protein
MNGADKTWNAKEIPGVTQTLNYYGGAEQTIIKEDGLHLTADDNYGNTGQLLAIKTLEAFEYVLKHFEFDYLLRTNQSSYINKERYIKWLEDKPKENFYSGLVGKNQGKTFVSGAAMTFSKDLIENLVSRKNDLPPNTVDDVAIAQMLNKITRIPAPRINVENGCRRFNAENPLPSDVHHFRCCHKGSHNRQGDVDTMLYLHELMKKDKK